MRLLLLAHGSRDPRHAATVTALVREVRAHAPGLAVDAAYLDHCAPSIPQALSRLAAARPEDRQPAHPAVPAGSGAGQHTATGADRARRHAPAALAAPADRSPLPRHAEPPRPAGTRTASPHGPRPHPGPPRFGPFPTDPACPDPTCPSRTRPGHACHPDHADHAGSEPVVAVPLLLAHAFHAKHDVPAALARAAARHPQLTVHQAPVLGPSPLLLAALDRRLAEAGVHPDPRTGIVLAAAGSSDATANAATRATADAYAATRGWAGVAVAHASAAPPRVADAAAALRARGATRIAVAPYLLAPGLLPDRIAAEAASCAADALAAPLGPAPELARLILTRAAQALPHTPATPIRPVA